MKHILLVVTITVAAASSVLVVHATTVNKTLLPNLSDRQIEQTSQKFESKSMVENGSNLESLGDAIALNPQPLPPRKSKLNPQPLPPRR